MLIAIAVPAAVAAGFLSWSLVEKPALRLKLRLIDRSTTA